MQTSFFAPKRSALTFLTILAFVFSSPPAFPAEPCHITQKASFRLGATPALLTVPAHIDGEAVTMGLDTGAHTYVSPETASRLRLPRDYGRRTRSIGTTAVLNVNNVLIRDLEFAGVHFRDKSVPSIPLEGKVMFGDIGVIGTGISGLIGADLMSNYDFELDLKQFRLTLYKVSGCKTVKPEWAGDYLQTPIEITGSRKVALPVEIDGVKLKAILDTGAGISAITRAAAARVGLTAAALKSDPASAVIGAGNVKADVPFHTFQNVAAAGLKTGPMKVSILKISSGESDVLLGLDFMRSKKLWISYATRTLFIQPQAAPLLPQMALGAPRLPQLGSPQISQFWGKLPGQASLAPKPDAPAIPAPFTPAAPAAVAEDGYLGAPIRSLMEETTKTLELPPGLGVMLERVLPGGPAAEAGLLAGDIVTALNGAPAFEKGSYETFTFRRRAGETVRIDILRNKQPMTINVKLIGAAAGTKIGVEQGGATLIVASEKRIAELFPRSEFPLEWAHAQYNIGLAYTESPDGNKAENAEASIPYYEAALSIATFKRRIAWDKAQINLGRAYRQRSKGGRQDNIERAIAAFNAVVTERPKSNFEWVNAQKFLGYAYLDRLAGDRNANTLSAIDAFEGALSVTKSTSPLWAELQDRRGDLYLLVEPKGSPENIDSAIDAYNKSIQYKPQGNKPELHRRARSAEKLGNCYRQRKQGLPSENAVLAAKAFEQALTVFTREAYPEDFARVQALKDEAQAKAGAEPAHEPL